MSNSLLITLNNGTKGRADVLNRTSIPSTGFPETHAQDMVVVGRSVEESLPKRFYL
jgi:hypothetical protein